MERRRWVGDGFGPVSRFALAVFFIVYALYALVSGSLNGGSLWVILEALSAGIAGVALAVGY